MQTTDVLAPNISFTGQEWTTSVPIDFRKSRSNSLMRHWSERVGSVATMVSEKARGLTQEELADFYGLLEA